MQILTYRRPTFRPHKKTQEWWKSSSQQEKESWGIFSTVVKAIRTIRKTRWMITIDASYVSRHLVSPPGWQHTAKLEEFPGIPMYKFEHCAKMCKKYTHAHKCSSQKKQKRERIKISIWPLNVDSAGCWSATLSSSGCLQSTPAGDGISHTCYPPEY